MSKVLWWFRKRWSKGLSPPFPPSLSSLSPNTAVHGAASVALTVNGNYFLPGAKINFGATVYTAVFVSQTQLTATIAAADLVSAGTKNVTVSNPDGRVTTALTFTLT
jgi:hypothetical protein